MSRAAAAGPLTVSSRNIFVTQVRQADGSLKPVMSSQALSDQSIRVNRTWLDNEEVMPGKYRKKCTNSGALFLLRLLQSRGNIYQNGGSPLLNYNLWGDIASWLLGVNLNFHNNEITLINHYAVATTPYPLVHHQQLGIFSRAEMDPVTVVVAATSGQEHIVLNILNVNPSYLLTTAKVKNSVGVEHEVTPLQAAIMANDVQLIERMKPYFERLTDSAGNPIEGLAEMKRQMIEIYKKSLWQYFYLTGEKIEKLNAEIKTLEDSIAALKQTISTLERDKYQKPIDWRALREAKETLTTKNNALEAATEARSTAKKNSAQYLTTLKSDITDTHYLETLIETHNEAQEHNAFDFQPYIDAICNASQAELDDVMALIDAKTPEETAAVIARTGVSPTQTDEARAKSFDQLTLVEKLNRFREKLSECRREEIISNSHHTIKSGELNDHIWDEVDAGRVADPNYQKRSIIFSQVYGRAQVTEEEAVRQDLRQGTYYLTKENPEPRRRPSNFNYLARADYRDVSLVDRLSLVGWGYKFSPARCGAAGGLGAGAFKTYVEQKQQAFRTCYAACASIRPQA